MTTPFLTFGHTTFVRQFTDQSLNAIHSGQRIVLQCYVQRACWTLKLFTEAGTLQTQIG